MDKKVRMKRGEFMDISDDTQSVNSEDILETFPDQTEELLREILLKKQKKH